MNTKSFLILLLQACLWTGAIAWVPSARLTTPSHAALSTLSSAAAPLTVRFMSEESGDSLDVATGTVKWFDSQKGFGFILPDDGSPDIFVHQSAIYAEGFRSLADGEAVEYRVTTDNNGRRKAIDVTGPGGVQVQGAPFRPATDYDSY